MSVFYDDRLRPELIEQLRALNATQQRRELLDTRQARAQEKIADNLDKIYRKLFRPSPPGRPALKMTSENGSMSKFKLTPDWATADADVVSADVSYSVAGADAVLVNVLKGASVEDIEGNQGDSFHVALTYIDDAQPTPLRSPTTEHDFVLQDTIAPAAPGVPVLEMTSET